MLIRRVSPVRVRPLLVESEEGKSVDAAKESLRAAIELTLEDRREDILRGKG